MLNFLWSPGSGWWHYIESSPKLAGVDVHNTHCSAKQLQCYNSWECQEETGLFRNRLGSMSFCAISEVNGKQSCCPGWLEKLKKMLILISFNDIISGGCMIWMSLIRAGMMYLISGSLILFNNFCSCIPNIQISLACLPSFLRVYFYFQEADPSHVFTTSIYYGLNVQNSPNLLMRVTTCDKFILISPYYITMKSICFNHKNWGLLRTRGGPYKWGFLSGHPHDGASSRGLGRSGAVH